MGTGIPGSGGAGSRIYLLFYCKPAAAVNRLGGAAGAVDAPAAGCSGL
jgi:hypothetical protein